MKKTPKTSYGPGNPHPLSMMRTELVWDGKYDEFGERREIDLAGRSFPLQRIETIDEPRSHAEASQKPFDFDSTHWDDFRNRLIWGDNRLVMASLMSEFKGAIDLIYIDPPFDVGADFTLSAPIGDSRETIEKEQSIMEMVAYRDIWGRGMDSYIGILSEQLTMMRDLLSEQGSIYVHCDWRVNSAVRLCLDEIFGAGNFKREIIWNLKTASGYKSQVNGYIRGHDTILYYVKSNEFTFNKQYKEHKPEYIERMFKKDDDGRLYRERGKGRKRQYLDESKGVALTDVWSDIKPIQVIANSSQKTGYPTQKPETLYERVIKASSNERDLVADFFCGSGTMAAVAEKLGRRWIASDLGRFAIHTTQKRLISTQRELHQEKEKYRSFDLFNLGRYERQWWQQESIKGADDEHRSIVLSFFRAEELTPPPPSLTPLIPCYTDVKKMPSFM